MRRRFICALISKCLLSNVVEPLIEKITLSAPVVPNRSVVVCSYLVEVCVSVSSCCLTAQSRSDLDNYHRLG